MTEDINFTTAEGAEVPQHAQTRELKETVMYPQHVQRGAESAEFQASKAAEEASGEGCYICGVTQAELGETIRLEGHHANSEWALVNSLDLAKVQKYFPDATSLDEFLDSKENLILLCPKHHRSPLYGAHMISGPSWVTQRLQLDNWDLVTGPTTSGTDTLKLEQVDTKDWYPKH
jgi:hypothetical protein